MPKILPHHENTEDSREVQPIRVALVGNPNSGKTSLFNALTGARQRVGNYPGVTVERREGFCDARGVEMQILDLPGTYSLATTSDEERVARDVVMNDEVDVVVCVVDSTNLERNLYLVVHLLELGLPVMVALNMIDAARARGIRIDATKLAKLLRVPVVETVARQGRGIDELLDAIRSRQAFGPDETLRIEYGHDVETEILRLEEKLRCSEADLEDHLVRSSAIRLLESRSDCFAGPVYKELRRAAREAARRVEKLVGEPVDIVIAGRRHGAAAGISLQVIRSNAERWKDITARVDTVLVHRVLGLPIFFAAMYLVFFFSFTVADPMAGGIESVFAVASSWLQSVWPETSFALLRSLVIDGMVGGVGGVIVFLPNIVLLFLAISLLEDSGYMARAAFLMDRLMRAVGLHGKSFIPMLLGFGCSVPAIMATRTIESRRARLVTMLVLPLMSCGARLPIYALIIPAFFPTAWHAPVLWLIYMSGVALALLLAWFLRSTMFAGRGLPFVMELPPYRMPTVRSVVTHMTERAWMYLKKAGTVILGISMIMWALATFPRIEEMPAQSTAEAQVAATTPAAYQLSNSFAGRIGQAMEPIVEPLGFDWKIGTALVGAFAAKEVFVAQLAIVGSVEAGEEDVGGLREQLRESYSPLVGLCVMLFCLISSPCMATVAVTARESGSWRWAALQWFGLTAVAWLVTFVVFQVGSLLSLGV